MSTTATTRRPTVRWGAVLGILLLATFGAVWWASGIDRETASADARTEELVLAQADENESDADEPMQIASVDVTYDVFLARDPFESIRPPEPVVADPTAPNGTDPSPTQPQPSDPSAPPTTDPVPGSSTGTCATGTEAVCNGTVIVLREVSTTAAVIEVNGVPFAVTPGDTFAQNFQFLSTDGSCVDVLYLNGDEADVFRLCDGDIVAK